MMVDADLRRVAARRRSRTGSRRCNRPHSGLPHI